MTLKELKKLSFATQEEKDLPLFDYIYLVSKKEKHDSNFQLIDVYGWNIKLQHGYKLGEVTDILEITIPFLLNEYEQLTIDYPDKNVARYYFLNRENIKFKVFFRLSTFCVTAIKTDKGW